MLHERGRSLKKSAYLINFSCQHEPNFALRCLKISYHSDTRSDVLGLLE